MLYHLTYKNESVINLVAEPAQSLFVDNPNRIFDQGNANFSYDPVVNELFLKGVLGYFSIKLSILGHVFLNEVFDSLGLSRTVGGAVLGWTYDGGMRSSELPLFEWVDLKDRQGFELKFQVDGIILDKI